MKPEKPFCLDYEEAHIELFNAITQISKVHNVPFYLLETILVSALAQVRDGKRAELEAAQRAYEEQMKQYEIQGSEQND